MCQHPAGSSATGHVRGLRELDARLAADPALVAAFLAGEPAAVVRLAQLADPVLTGVIKGALGTRLASHLPDVLQSVWWAALKARARFGQRPETSLAAWLGGVAVRRARQVRRAEARRARRFDFAYERGDGACDAADDLEDAAGFDAASDGAGFGDDPDVLRAADAEAAMALLDQLPHPQREVVVARVLEDLTQEATAEALGITVSMVKTRLTRGLRRLARLLRARPAARAPGPTRRSTKS